MKPPINLIGKIYGEWEVLNEVFPRTRPRKWMCKRSCGLEKPVWQGHLTSGNSSSCTKCESKLRKLRTSKYSLHHPFYINIIQIRKRCNNPNYQHYKYYGGRGIKVCFDSVIDFVKYLDTLWFDQFGNYDFSTYGPNTDQYSIDHVNNNKNYEPWNLRFSTKLEQRHNRND